MGRGHNYHKGRAALRIYANQPALPLWLMCLRPNFTSTYHGVNARLALCLNSVLNVKALVCTFNQEKDLHDLKTDGSLQLYSSCVTPYTNIYYVLQDFMHSLWRRGHNLRPDVSQHGRRSDVQSSLAPASLHSMAFL